MQRHYWSALLDPLSKERAGTSEQQGVPSRGHNSEEFIYWGWVARHKVRVQRGDLLPKRYKPVSHIVMRKFTAARVGESYGKQRKSTGPRSQGATLGEEGCSAEGEEPPRFLFRPLQCAGCQGCGERDLRCRSSILNVH